MQAFQDKVNTLPPAPAKRGKGKAKGKAAGKGKGKGKGKGNTEVAATKVGQKVRKTTTKKTKEAKEAIWDELDFKPSFRKPRYYGSITIYTSQRQHQWRIKPGPGRPDEFIFGFSGTPEYQELQWMLVVRKVKSLPQV